MRYGDDVRFDGDKYFSGSLDIDWYLSSPEKTILASESYLFHSKEYLTGNAKDRKSIGGKVLTDSVSMTEEVLHAFDDNNPFILSIAGYGAGKTHLALAISMLFSNIGGNRDRILEEIKKVDENAAKRINDKFSVDNRPYLVIPINGIRNANLMELIFDTAFDILTKCNCSKKCLADFDPRFKFLKQTVLNLDGTKKALLFTRLGLNEESFKKRMDSSDEELCDLVAKELEKFGIEMLALSKKGELKDLIPCLANSLCGEGLPFKGLLLVFDEFGKYISFAASNESVAGSGVVQQIFEGVSIVDKKKHPIVLWGLSQLDLQAYLSTLKNDVAINNMQKEVSKLKIAKRFYLSICFESLIANLIFKKQIPSYLSSSGDALGSIKTINKYFPVSKQYPVWTSIESFSKVVRNGCWPLSALAVWTLSYITSVNNILQQRSGFSILLDLFSSLEGDDVPEGQTKKFPIKAVDLYDAGLGMEFIDAEQTAKGVDQIAHECEIVIKKYGQQMRENDKKILKAIVLSSKLNAYCTSEDDSKALLAHLSGVKIADIDDIISVLFRNFNCIFFNSGSKLFEIRSNTITGGEFRQNLRDKVEYCKEKNHPRYLFGITQEVIEKSDAVNELRETFFEDIECDFALKNGIFSGEWNFKKSIIVCYDNYITQTCAILNDLKTKPPVAFNEAKGRMIYYLIPSSQDPQNVVAEIKKLFDKYSQESGRILPVMGLVLHDKDNLVRDNAIELKVIDELPPADKKKYETLIPVRIKELQDDMFNVLNELKLKRYLVYPINSNKARFITGSIIFKEIYPSTIAFNVDGFREYANTGANTISKFIECFSMEGVSWNSFLNLDVPSINRAKALLNRSWGVFDRNGVILKYPRSEVIAGFFKEIDVFLETQGDLSIIDVYQRLLEPPYGCNSSQATLLLFVFIAGRYNVLEIKQNGHQVLLSSLVNQKMFFELKTKAFKVSSWEDVVISNSVKDDIKWFNLYDQWKQESSYSGLCACLSNFDSLTESHISIPGVITKEIYEFVSKSRNVKDVHDSWIKKSSPIISAIEISTMKANNVDVVVQEIVQLEKLYKDTVGKSKSYLSDEERKTFNDFVKEAKGYVSNNLSQWFADNGFPSDLSEISLVLKKYDNLISRLDSISLKNEVNDAKSKRESLSVQYSSIKAFHNKKAGLAKKWGNIKDNRKYASSSASLAYNCLKEIDDALSQIEDISYIPDGCTLDDIRYELIGLRSLVNNDIQNMQNFIDTIGDTALNSFDDIDSTEKKLSKAYTYYDNSPDLKNFNIVKSASEEISYLKALLLRLGQGMESFDEIDELLYEYQEKLDKMKNAPIPYASILYGYKVKAFEELTEKSSRWIEMITSKYEQCLKMSDYMSLSSLIALPPKYLTDYDITKLKDIKMNVEDRISTLKVEYIVELYKGLSNKDQKELLDKLSKI